MTPDIAVAMVVTRTDLVLPDLALEDDGVYGIVGIGPGGQAWRRNLIVGRYQHGSVSLGETLEDASLVGLVRVYGATWLEVRTRAAALFTALAQHAYTVTLTIDGVIDTYTCRPGDIDISGGDLQKHHVRATMQEYQFTIPYEVGV